MHEWQNLHDNDAPDNVTLETKIDDANGCRNEQTLMRRGNLWWYPDGSMYVYYRPTHWRYVEPLADPSPKTNVWVTPEIAARVLYDNWSGLASLPSPARELASQGHFFSALRLLFEPDADLTKPPKVGPMQHNMGDREDA